MKASMISYKSLFLFFVLILSVSFMVSCEKDSIGDDFEQKNNTTGNITINGESYFQHPDFVASVTVYSDDVECGTNLFKKFPSMPDYELYLKMAECIQGKEVGIRKIHIRNPSVVLLGEDQCELISGKIVCKKKTDKELSLKFSEVKIQVKTSYLLSNTPKITSYTLNGSLSFVID